MSRNYSAFICAVLLLSTFESTVARKYGRGGSHSYPKSGGLSGGGHHSYPSSGGLSGGHHSYPSSGGLSGGGHGYPSSGNSHGYPSSGNSHGYPASGGLSGSGSGNRYPSNTQTNGHGYPASGGLSGNSRPGTHTTNVHHHYHYNPPSQISYTPHGASHPVSYPVYHGTPPTYVYQYKDSGSKYGTLLTGLALLNLGALGATAYALHSNSHSNNYASYKPQPGEYCKFGMRKENGDYEETRIDCQLITSFIFQAEAEKNHSSHNTTIVSTTVTNVTTVNQGEVVPLAAVTNFTMLPNGSMVPVETSTDIIPTQLNTTEVKTDANPQSTSSFSTTVTNTTTVVDALQVKGSPVEVTPGMTCYVIRRSSSSDLKKTIPCGLLQTYAEKSIKPNSASRNAPVLTVLAAVVVALAMY